MAPLNVLFVDWHNAFLDVVRAEFAAEIEEGSVRTFCGDVRTLVTARAAFVSPSNSLLFFDGGYDDALRKMFPGLQEHCQAKVKQLDLRTALSRNYLPIGSALVVPTGPDCCVVAAPTMFLPHDVSRTRNAYHSLMAALMVISQNDRYDSSVRKFDTLVVPAMCCGYGKMTHVESASQMHEAMRDFLAGRRPTADATTAAADDPSFFIGPRRDDEQPDNFDNREIKDVDVANIKHVGTMQSPARSSI